MTAKAAKSQPSFEDETSLIPGLIAHSVIQELAGWIDSNMEHVATSRAMTGVMDRPASIKAVIDKLDNEADAFSQNLADRAKDLYQRNPDVASKLRREDGRDYLYSLMRHWLCGLLCKDESLKPVIKALPETYALGAELPKLSPAQG